MTFSEFCAKYSVALNEQQTKAVQRTDGATLLLAVPGSGKTTVITARIAFLVKCCGVNPHNILALTFTKAAAKEMRDRYIARFGAEYEAVPHFSTINSFCVKVLKKCASEKNESIPKLEPDNIRFIRQTAEELIGEYPTETLISHLVQMTGKAKNLMLNDDELKSLQELELEAAGSDFHTFFGSYQENLLKEWKMDFDDQLILAYRLLQKYPDILSRARNQYRYICLDEAQDTSLIQHKIVEMLAGKNGNVFYVGDEDQSIYGFRGAYPKQLMDFTSIYNNAEKLFMGKNYRSDNGIVESANNFIRRNEERQDKNMSAAGAEHGTVSVTVLDDMLEQPHYISQKIKQYAETPEKTLAVLYRNNDSAIMLLDELIREKLSVRIANPVSAFFSHYIVSDIICFLNFALDPQNLSYFEFLHNKMGLYLPEDKLAKLGTSGTQNEKNSGSILDRLKELSATEFSKEKLTKLSYNLYLLAHSRPDAAIDIILAGLGYKENWLDKKLKEGASEDALMLKINILRAVASKYETAAEFLSALEAIKNCVSEPASNVTLSTIHSSKGMEFDEVLLIDAIDGILPQTSLETDAEEEVRLFYVGATRAKHRLEIIASKKLYDMTFSKSRFTDAFENVEEGGSAIASISNSALQKREQAKTYYLNGGETELSTLKVGDTVRHPGFGAGIVQSITGAGLITVDFQDIGVRKFLRDNFQN